jgi:ubiquinone/menaquinone biosynthesis C-methylase UbiE
MATIPPDENTYMIDIESAAETTRLIMQDRLLTAQMGGLFPEGLDTELVRDILDLACGPGGWALDTAFHNPECRIIGVDLSQRMIAYAEAQAITQQLTNISFERMDVLQPLAFADQSFDLVNGRLLRGFMSTAAWPQLLRECWRITRPGGLIRITDCEPPLTTSAPFEQLKAWYIHALWKAGHSFSPDGRHGGLVEKLGPLLRDTGYQQITHRASAIDFSTDTAIHRDFFQDFVAFFELLQPFCVEMEETTQEELDRVYATLLNERDAPHFCAVQFFLTVSGRKPA